jgi:predicted RND superfamily exporter protein
MRACRWAAAAALVCVVAACSNNPYPAELMASNTLVYTFIFALVVIFLVLAAQYESFRDPFIILVALPTSMFGALIPLNAGLATINIYTQIGLVTLIGLISKHGILMVDFANKLQADKGLSRRAAIEEAAATRLRPILMTTAAMVVAMVPLLIAKGAGAASRFDIGVVIAAGMTIGTIFTLFVTPAVYTFLAKDYQKARARKAEHATSASEAAPATAEADVPTKAAGQETAAADLATVASEGQREEGHSAEVLAFSSAAAAASTEKDKGRKGGRKPPKRKPLNPAAE